MKQAERSFVATGAGVGREEQNWRLGKPCWIRRSSSKVEGDGAR